MPVFKCKSYIIKAVSGITCSAEGTECDNIANAECYAKKCKCSDGFVMNVDVCAPENTGKVFVPVVTFIDTK